MLLLYLYFALCFSTTTNISSKHALTSEMSGSDEDVVSMHKRQKRSNNNSLLETVTSIMKEPIQINLSSLQKEDTVPASVLVQTQDNISHIMILLGNLLREFPGNEGFSYGLQFLQLASEKKDQLRKKL